MSQNPEPSLFTADRLITRRATLGGLVTAVLIPALLGKASAAGPAPLEAQAVAAQPSVRITASPLARMLHTASALPDGRILVAGGVGSGNRALSSVQIYDPIQDVWTDAAPMEGARFQHAATVLSTGQVLVIGGLYRSSTPRAAGEIYDPGADRWSPAPSMLVPRYGHTLTALADGQIIVTGGSNLTPLSSVEIYLPYPNV